MRSMAELHWYVLTHRPGPAVTAGSAFDHPGIGEHYAFLGRLRGSGALIAAGPLTDVDGEGMTVVDAPSLDEAVRLATEDDQSVVKGVLQVTVRPWHVMMFIPPEP